MTSLSGKRAFVTGGSRGIGAAIARRLAEDGADVAISSDRAADRADEVVAAIRASGGTGAAVRMGASDAGSIEAAVNGAADALGGLDILVNNAGIWRAGPIDEMTLEDIDEALAVNLRGVILATRAALPRMADEGRIILTGSNLGGRAGAGTAVYSAAKAALGGFARGLARDVGPRAITVNVIHPGSTDTDMNPADGPFAERQRERMAIPRYARPEDVAAFYAFVASAAARSINGAELVVDGGANA